MTTTFSVVVETRSQTCSPGFHVVIVQQWTCTLVPMSRGYSSCELVLACPLVAIWDPTKCRLSTLPLVPPCQSQVFSRKAHSALWQICLTSIGAEMPTVTLT